MQNRYVGDVGDFGKYALLRNLISIECSPFILGIHWHLFPDESHNSDGRHTSYLERPDFRCLDPVLHDALAKIVLEKRRAIASLRDHALFGKQSIEFMEPVTQIPSGGNSGSQRVQQRAVWHSRAMLALREASLVFFDPDNGIETKSVPKSAAKSGKFAYWDEIGDFWKAGKSLVIYHHLNRTASNERQIEILKAHFSERLGHIPLLLPLIFRRGSCRVFWVVANAGHSEDARKGVSAMLGLGWDRHFTVG